MYKMYGYGQLYFVHDFVVQDPSGSRVFAVHDKAWEAGATSHYAGRQNSSDVDVLRQRVKQLEEELTKHNVD